VRASANGRCWPMPSTTLSIPCGPGNSMIYGNVDVSHRDGEGPLNPSPSWGLGLSRLLPRVSIGSCATVQLWVGR